MSSTHPDISTNFLKKIKLTRSSPIRPTPIVTFNAYFLMLDDVTVLADDPSKNKQKFRHFQELPSTKTALENRTIEKHKKVLKKCSIGQL